MELDWSDVRSCLAYLASGIWIAYLYSFVALCHLFVPGPVRKGYAKDARGETLLYKLNGFATLGVSVCLCAVLVYFGIVSGSHLFDNFWPNLTVANLLGMVISLLFYMRGEFHPKDHVSGNRSVRVACIFTEPWRALHGFFFGYELNPRLGLWDVKMVLYLVGAVQLQLHVLSAVYVQWMQLGTVTSALAVYAFELSFFCCDYLWFEHVHTFTYDLIAENVGFKLIWGCLCFYPFFYISGAFAVVDASSRPSEIYLCMSVFCFLSGWLLSRGANLQKFYFKTQPNELFLGFIKQKSINNRILCSGFWGISRHINYLGEILMAIGIAIPGGLHSWVPWLYPLYYVVLLFPRERDDNSICKIKYGAHWLEYEQLVPYRIIPYIY
eukprot:TRINITY_DN1316_c0_g1_i1.p1 TRINITY_DN1316_c0_g1~~TRINITY_DN1316_c0_g1_i1.p1  ORF type:complete len:382 (+),score=-59.41 TRINITY_DN1316_c0_g1_i1:61-1206(+)